MGIPTLHVHPLGPAIGALVSGLQRCLQQNDG